MMETLQIINTVGFPIAAFLLMYYHNTKTLKDYNNTLKELITEIKLNRELIRSIVKK